MTIQRSLFTTGPTTTLWLRKLRKDPLSKAVAKAKALSHASGELVNTAQSSTQRLASAPYIQPPQELFNSSAKVARRVKPRSDVASEVDRARNVAARTMDTLMKEISRRLKSHVAGFPTFHDLHPFERSIMDLAVGQQNYIRIVSAVDELRKDVVKVSKHYATQASAAPSTKRAEEITQEGILAVESALVNKGEGSFWEIQELSKKMRRIPQIDAYVPTVALVGAPNVGKSSLVNALSSGTPEVCNYPFTTRSIKVGHFYANTILHQVMDTPGLLYRPDDDRNAMELLTVATLEHLPTAAVFVLDLTEQCGCSCQEQWQIRRELLARFPHKLWIDVITKIDMLEEEIDAALELEDVTVNEDPVDAMQMIRRLPHAVKVSSLTTEGLDQLQEAVLDLMTTENWSSQIDAMRDRDKAVLNEQ